MATTSSLFGSRRPLELGPFLILLLLAGSGCQPDDDDSPGVSPSPEPAATAPILNTDPEQIDFGSVEVGATATATLTISNDGNAKLVVELALTEGTAFSLQSDPGPLYVDPGTHTEVVVLFAPSDTGDQEGTLRIESNDESRPEVFVPLSGTAVPPDRDEDGFPGDEDCDDEDPGIYPGAEEVCDGLDNDCDGDVDEDLLIIAYADEDGDGYGDPDTGQFTCTLDSGTVDNGDDCDDTDPAVHPGADEICDGLDNDCDGAVDDADTVYPTPADLPPPQGASTWYRDEDGDGYGVIDDTVSACEPPPGYAALPGDCNDTDPRFHPGADESDCTDLNDYNCDGSVSYADADGDGYAACEECDDANATVYPGADEICDGLDNDCDTEVDEGLTTPFYQDADGDGFGNPDAVTEACALPEGHATNPDDCDDQDATVYPMADEICDGKDNDCDGAVDDEDTVYPTPQDAPVPNEAPEWYRDSDGDGYGSDDDIVVACSAPDGYVAQGGDCNDEDPRFHPNAIEDDCSDPNDYNCDGSVAYADEDQDGFLACVAEGAPDCNDQDATVYPGAEEVCDEQDNDCDGSVDEEVTLEFYLDADGDGFGDPAVTVQACSAPDGYVENSADCNDAEPTAFPTANEICDGIDNDCDLEVDEPDALDAPSWFQDSDGDGYGTEDTVVVACTAPEGFAPTAGDCNDADPRFHPGATEDDCTDPNDYNCDGSVAYADEDADGIPACEDCNDSEPSAYPGAEEVCDGMDNDCDGAIDEEVTIEFYPDTDGDGFGAPGSPTTACSAPEGYVTDNTDCDDQDGDVNPAALEACNNKDDDCDGDTDEPGAEGCATIYHDNDGDTYGGETSSCECESKLGWVSRGGDCNDDDAGISPDAREKCNGVDDNCDGEVDEPDAQGCDRYWADEDQDGFGNPADYACLCEPTGVYTATNATDCLDSDATVYPNGPEVCDEKDNNCNGQTDEGVKTTFYLDNDGDGFGALYNSREACSAPDGYVAQGGDCNDYNAEISPTSPEQCDNIDNNCNGQVDENLPEVLVYKDNDGDGHGASGIPGVESCLYDQDGDGVGESPPLTYSLTADDCDDSDVTIYTGATETCDGKDNDCDGNVDPLCYELCDGDWPFRLDYSYGKPSAIIATDLNGDGMFEILVQDNFGFAILSSEGTPYYDYSAANHNYSRGRVVLADIDTYDQFNADTQWIEVLTGNGSHPTFYKLNADKTVSVFQSSDGVYDASRFMAADVNLDGQIEFYTTSWCHGSQGVRMFRFDRGSGTIQHVNDIADPEDTCEYTAGRTLTDLDGDGIPEIVFGNGYGQATSPGVWGGHVYAFALNDGGTLSYDLFCSGGSCFQTDIPDYYPGAVYDLFRVGDEVQVYAIYFETAEPNVANPSTGRYWAFDISGQALEDSPASSQPPGWYPTDVNDDGQVESSGAMLYLGLWDVNGDGFPDRLYSSGSELRIALWDEEHGTFEEHTPSRFVVSGVGVSLYAAWDIDGDGRINVLSGDDNGNVYCHSLGQGTWNKAASLPPHFPAYLRTYQWDNYEPNEGQDIDGDGVPDRFIRVASALTKKGNFYSYLSHPDDLDFYLVDASWSGNICLTAPRGRRYTLDVYSYYDRWDNTSHDPTPDGLRDGLIWSTTTSAGGTACFHGSYVVPYRYGEYRFVIGISSEEGYSPYWPYWISAPK